jgi:hypothetical protein
MQELLLMIQAGVARDSQQPAFGRKRGFDRIPVLIGFEIGFLGQFFGVLGVLGEAQADPEDLFPVGQQVPKYVLPVLPLPCNHDAHYIAFIL